MLLVKYGYNEVKSIQEQKKKKRKKKKMNLIHINMKEIITQFYDRKQNHIHACLVPSTLIQPLGIW